MVYFRMPNGGVAKVLSDQDVTIADGNGWVRCLERDWIADKFKVVIGRKN